jgi:hypothetical protein
MAINWGIALGKGIEAGLSTYERLGEEEARQMQREKMRRELEQEKALDLAFANTQGRVGQKDDYGVAIQKASGNAGIDMGQAKMLSQQGALSGGTAEDMDFERASAEAAAGAMRENAARQGKVADSALPRMEAEEYTSRQAMGDYAKEASKVGGRKGAIEALQMKKAFRQDDLDTKFDAARQGYADKLSLINGTAESQGMKGLAELAKKNGLKVEFVEAKNGVGKINVLGPKGDVLQSITSVGEATQALEQAATKQFQSSAVALLGDESKLLTYLNQREEIGMKKDYYAGAAEESRAKASYYRAGGASMNRAPKKEVSNADIINFVKQFGDQPSNEKDPKTGKAIPIGALPPGKQAAYAQEFYTGRDVTGGGLPDVPQGGLKLEKPQAKESLPTTGSDRRFEGQKFGALTPRAVVEEAARAGNKDAIAYLEGMQRNKLAQELDYGSNMPL